MFSTSRTTFSPLLTNGLLSGLHEQLSQYTYTTAAVDFGVWFVTLHTISKEQIMSAKWRIGVLLGWLSMGKG
jgi:hypothetical protein